MFVAKNQPQSTLYLYTVAKIIMQKKPLKCSAEHRTKTGSTYAKPTGEKLTCSGNMNVT